jgi:SpoVK/Ycf46/Vps4 family AAA+-type ATPase
MIKRVIRNKKMNPGLSLLSENQCTNLLNFIKRLEDIQLTTGKPLRKGVVLFTGRSKVRKEIAANFIASNLGSEVHEVNLCALTAKYIGETEKNLERVFHAASNADAVLFFDEADALFGKRTDVKDSHDRYANLEISYLLQRIEDYPGTVILATNLKKSIDMAFIRRCSLILQFPAHRPARKGERDRA